jgi:uncharacterized membrane protein YdjX (TVP38/TMEM64 family)
VFVGATLGAAAAYGVSYRLADTPWLRRLDREPRVIVVRRAVQANSLWVQLLLRLSPLVPFTILNFALGLARVKFKDFVVALVGMIPAIILYTYYGRIVGDVTAIAAGASVPRTPAYYVLLGAGLVTTVVASVVIARAARRALADPLGTERT